MITDLQALERVLAASVKRNGEKPLTNAYMLNITRMALRVKARAEVREIEFQNQLIDEVLGEDAKWGSS